MEVEILHEDVAIFNTETNEGDLAVLASFKASILNKAMIVLSHDKRNGAARRVARWATRPRLAPLYDPDFHSLTAVVRQAGFEAYHFVIKPGD